MTAPVDAAGSVEDRTGVRRRAVLVGVALVVVLAAGLALTARRAGDDPRVSISGAAVGATESEVAAAYLDVTNHAATDDALVTARCTCAARTSLHVTTIDDRSLVRMRHTDVVDLPASSTVRMGPAGTHVMLVGLHRPLRVGDSVRLELEFRRAPARTVEVPVVPIEDVADRAAGPGGPDR